jgi:hypothetical protein
MANEHPMLLSSAQLALPSVQMSLAERALFDIWAFADLIGFRSEERKFYKLHYDMADWLANVNRQPETNKPSYSQLQRIILAPRDHRKSTVCSTLYVMWRIYRNPNIRILLCCNVKELAMAFISEIRRYFEDEDLVERVWDNRPHIAGSLVPTFRKSYEGYKLDDWNFETDVTEDIVAEQPDNRKRKWTNYKLEVLRTSKAKEPTVLALSVGQRATGQHYDIVIMDDVVDLVNSSSPAKAEKVASWYDDIATNVLSKKPVWTQVSNLFNEWVGSELIVIGTRYFSWDLYSGIVEPPDYEYGASVESAADINMDSYVTAMETYSREVSAFDLFFRTVYVNNRDAADGYVCPEIFDADAETNVKAKLRDLATFYAQYCNIVLNSLTSKLAPYRITLSTQYQSLTHGYARFFENREVDERTRQPKAYDVALYAVADLAISQKARADYSCIMVGGFDERGVLHVVDGIDGRFTVDGFIDKCWTLLDKWHVNAIHYEGGVGYQDAFGEAFKRTFRDHRPVSVISSPVKRDIAKHARIRTTLPPLLDNGLLCVSDTVHRVTQVKSQFTLFGKLNAKDDCLDTIEKLATLAKPTRQLAGERSNVVNIASVNKRYGGFTRRFSTRRG